MVPVLADATGGSSSIAITSDMVKPLADAVTSNVGQILPVGITIMGVMLGVTLIPKIIYKFF